MATGQLGRVIEQLRSALAPEDAAGLPDGELLARYVRQRDEAAFEALVRRHGPMVLGVCRRVLSNSHDAEDAFQATFLVLVRRAASLQSPELVGNWLYGVACRAALEARKAAARRRAKEAEVKPQPAMPEDAWADLRPVLDRELARLPAKYRAAVVLCDLEGKTRKAAAEQLGWPEGTVASRLAAGRTMLAKRFARLGVAVSGGVLAAVLAPHASAGVPPAVLAATIRAASLFAADPAAPAIPATVAALTEGVLKAMSIAKLKIATAILVGLTFLGAGGAGLAMRTPRADHPGVVTQQLPAVRLVAAADADDVTLEAVPPVVVKTVPTAGADDVDPQLKEIKVTFSKDMQDGSWSWATLSKESFPTARGKPKYQADKRTCVLPVKLEPGKTYAIWLNSEKFGNFKDADGHSAVPYLLVFRTKKE